MAEYRIGVIGHTGQGNYGHGVDTVWGHIAGCTVVAVADPEPAGLQQAKKRLNAAQGYSDYRQMLAKEQLDIVSICPRWVNRHHEMVLACAQRKLHIYMEKPFCRELQEADEMVKACESNDIKLAIAHQTRYSPKLAVIRNLIEDGGIGTVLELRGRGKEDRRGGGEDLWVLGSHVFNLMQYFGGDSQWCMAQATQQGKRITKEHVGSGKEGIGPLAADSITAMYGMQDNIAGYFASAREAGNGARFALQIYGSRGVVEIQTGFLPQAYYLDDPTWCSGRSGKTWTPISSAGVGKSEPLKDLSLHAGNVVACQDLLQAIEQDRLPECNVYEARHTIEMIAATFESHRQRGQVAMPLIERRNPLTLLER